MCPGRRTRAPDVLEDIAYVYRYRSGSSPHAAVRFRPAAILVVATLTLVACGVTPGPTPSPTAPSGPTLTGPLAITNEPTQAVSASRGGEGPVEISDDCVTLETEAGHPITLVFRSGQVRWNDANREVAFLDPFVGTVVFSDGTSIEVGGESLGPGSAGEPPKTRQWITTPRRNCPPELFEVHSMKLVADALVTT